MDCNALEWSYAASCWLCVITNAWHYVSWPSVPQKQSLNQCVKTFGCFNIIFTFNALIPCIFAAVQHVIVMLRFVRLRDRHCVLLLEISSVPPIHIRSIIHSRPTDYVGMNFCWLLYYPFPSRPPFSRQPCMPCATCDLFVSGSGKQ